MGIWLSGNKDKVFCSLEIAQHTSTHLPLSFSSPEERTRQRLHLHRDRSGKQLHGAAERQVRGLVHGFHAQGPSEEGLQDQAAPKGGPLHEASTQGAPAEREETVWCPSSPCPCAPFEQADKTFPPPALGGPLSTETTEGKLLTNRHRRTTTRGNKCSQRNELLQSSAHTRLASFCGLCNSLCWIVCNHWLSNLLVISNSDKL